MKHKSDDKVCSSARPHSPILPSLLLLGRVSRYLGDSASAGGDGQDQHVLPPGLVVAAAPGRAPIHESALQGGR